LGIIYNKVSEGEEHIHRMTDRFDYTWLYSDKTVSHGHRPEIPEGRKLLFHCYMTENDGYTATHHGAETEAVFQNNGASIDDLVALVPQVGKYVKPHLEEYVKQLMLEE